jgi:hypothetical protein
MNPNPEQREAFTVYGLGFHCARAGDTLPQTTTEHLFKVTGGRCLIRLLYGEVTDTISATDPQIRITSTPTTGSAVALGATVDTKDMAIGAFLLCENDTTALVISTAGGIILAAGARKAVVPVGYIDLISAASQTGSIQWDLYYVPLDAGAYIEAV